MSKMKGLRNFIYEVKKCKTPEEEQRRVDLELEKIRAAFENPKKLSGYDRKKYVNKLVMIYLLGHKIAAVGFAEGLNLINSAKIGEKLAGYTYISIVMLNSADLSSSIITCIKNDVHSGKELPTTLALNCLSTVAGRNIMTELQSPIANFVLLSEIPTITRKKALLCLLKFFRLSPDTFPHKLLGHELVVLLESAPDLGLVTALVNLLRNVVTASPADYPGLVEAAVSRLQKLVTMSLEPAYVYHQVPAPWLTVSLLKLLQLLPQPADRNVLGVLEGTLKVLMSRCMQPAPERVGPNVFRGKLSYYHCNYACLIETAFLVAAYENLSVSSRELQTLATANLVSLLPSNGPTTKWGLLDALCALVQTRLGVEVLEPHQAFLQEGKRAEANAVVAQRFSDLLKMMSEDYVDEPYVPVATAPVAAAGGAAAAGGFEDEEAGYFAGEDAARPASDSDED